MSDEWWWILWIVVGAWTGVGLVVLYDFVKEVRRIEALNEKEDLEWESMQRRTVSTEPGESSSGNTAP